MRKLNRRIKLYNKEGTNVVNLSSQPLTKIQKYVLELGHGFVSTPNHKEKEEEILILEGLRVTDRILKLDKELTAQKQEINEINQNDNELEEIQNFFNNSNNETFLMDSQMMK